MNKTPPGIYPRTKCAKFQLDLSIFEVSRLPQSFWDIHRHTYTDRHSQILAQLKLRINIRPFFNKRWVEKFSKKGGLLGLKGSELLKEGLRYLFLVFGNDFTNILVI